MHYTYRTRGTCSSKIDFEINNGIITDVVFTGGCNGNHKAIGKLVDGWKAEDIAAKLSGNTCGFKDTSCADQLARAVMEAQVAEKDA
ncbi:MAG: TIGR03905 family TSCPD domain-containing protein [Clostridiales bacterium]|nr:TIGR03905 family TSCPD domain-containing protein [Candidatus Scatonaster coprocaballi]